jgi:hypothetical protein
MEKKDNQELFNETEEKYLKQYFQKLDKSLGVESETPLRLQASFNQKLDAIANPRRSSVLNWKTFSASVAGAFSIGAILARFLLMPAEVATRGVGEAGGDNHTNNGALIVVVASEPEKLVIHAIEAAFSTDLEVTTFKAGDKIQITLKPLRPYSKEQRKVKNLLNIKEDTSGEATVIVRPKP